MKSVMGHFLLANFHEVWGCRTCGSRSAADVRICWSCLGSSKISKKKRWGGRVGVGGFVCSYIHILETVKYNGYDIYIYLYSDNVLMIERYHTKMCVLVRSDLKARFVF